MNIDSVVGSGRRLEQTVLPTPNSIDLMRSAETDYIHRFVSKTPHIAELFHENSKCIPSMPMIATGAAEQRQIVQEWYYRTSYNVDAADINEEHASEVLCPLDAMPEKLQSLIRMCQLDQPAGMLLYALDLFVLNQGTIYRYLPGRDFLWIERHLGERDRARLIQSLFELGEEQCSVDTPMAFIVGAPWRYMMLYGPRGYRHTLVDAGRLLQILEMNMPITVSSNYYDQVLDDILQLDGTERSVLAAILCNIEGGNGDYLPGN